MSLEKRFGGAELGQDFLFRHDRSALAPGACLIRVAGLADKLLEASPSAAYKARNFAGPGTRIHSAPTGRGQGV